MTATEEKVNETEGLGEAPQLDDNVPEDLDDENTDEVSEGYEEGDDPGWLVVYMDGRQEVIAHPEGVHKNSIKNEAKGAMKKVGSVIEIGDTLINMEAVWSFGWSEDADWPEVERFDSMQDRIEALMGAVTMTAERTAFLAEQQAQLQAAQAQLFQVEMADMQADMVKAQQAALQGQPPAPAQGKRPKKQFRPVV